MNDSDSLPEPGRPRWTPSRRYPRPRVWTRFGFWSAMSHKACLPGEIARRLEVPHNTLSTHLGVLSRAGLIHSQREGRSLIYRANLEHMLATVQFLVRDCCAGSSVVCDPLLASLTVPDCSVSSTPCASQESRNDD